MKVTLAVCVFLMVFLGILANRSMNVRDWSTNHKDAVLYKSKEQLGGTVKEVDGVRNRVKRGSQGETPKKDSRVLGYPRLIHPLPSGIPELNKISNDTSLSSTLRPQLLNPLYPLSESSISAYGVLLLSLVVFAVGIIGNLSVMCIVWHSLYLKSAWDSILAGLALWDFLLLFFCLPVVVFQEITSRRLLGWLSCRIVPYMEVSSLGVSTFSLCALGIDRFQSVTSLQPSPRPVERCQSILGKLAIIWLGSLTLALPETLLWQITYERSHLPGVVHDTCIMQPAPNLPPVLHSLILTYQQARMWWFLGCYFCLPLLFTTTSLLVTLRIIGASKDTRHSQCQRQLSWLVAALATVYGICTLPENITNILVTYTNLDIPRDLMTLITQFFLFLKCAVTPVLLLCLSKPLGQAFLDCCCCCCEDGDKPNSTTTEGKKQTEEPLTPSHCAKDLDLPLGTPC
ncbi:G-protein coupled receptor 37-like 1 [Bombina bombina]|uniref:G-protein coupled receptor 37-like 1 n=1 Tax=Bombina bombina TaxID=8345 RepID=UPI00235A883F|nr:G-protein coupled receptor 37-like 1 [Bombina bombina]